MSALRSFRFLLEQGEIEFDLAGGVPAVAAWRHAGVPKYLSPEQVQQVLASCDRSTPMGRRDFTMLLMHARLGLRACEVARLDLDDIRWRTGKLIIRGKGSSIEALPLLDEVGKALAADIKRDRPQCQTRKVFTRVRAPLTALARERSVTTVVRALATSMLRDGASMSEIGVVLRHRSPATTEIYAKVDLTSLRRLALPWPVGGAP